MLEYWSSYHREVWRNSGDIYVSPLLLHGEFIRSSLLLATGVSQQDCLLSLTSHGSSCSAYVLIFRIVTVILHLCEWLHQLQACFQRGNPGPEKRRSVEKVTHSQPLPVGKQESPHLLRNAEAYYPEIWQQLPHEFRHIIMPNAVSADLHSAVFSQSGDHQQMMWRLFGIL